MNHFMYGNGWVGSPLSILVGPFIALAFLAALWSIFWKGVALWHAGRQGDNWWFVAILLINTLGILEIIYLFFVLKLRFDQLLTQGGHTHHHPHNHAHAHPHHHEG